MTRYFVCDNCREAYDARRPRIAIDRSDLGGSLMLCYWCEGEMREITKEEYDRIMGASK